jgi:predicted Fe-Mo cluster-binding NifX family protein
MKIAITSEGSGLDSSVDARFGRAKGFVIYDQDTRECVFISNEQNMDSPSGAGIQAAKTVINAGAHILITGNVGPKAYAALSTTGIEIFTGAGGKVRDAIDSYSSGTLQKASNANVEGHW